MIISSDVLATHYSYSMTNKHIVYFGLGSNLGDKEGNIRKALIMMEEQIGRLVRQSALLVTEPWGFDSANTFTNSVLLVDTCACYETTLQPLEILRLTKEIEIQLGRTVKSSGGQYHDRSIDIDILLYDNLEMQTDELTIPHPLMQKRDFVMIPLSEILS